MWEGKDTPLTTNATRQCLAYHTESIKQTNVWQQANILAGGQELLLAVNRRNQIMYEDICRHDTLPKITQQGTAVVAEEDSANHGRST